MASTRRRGDALEQDIQAAVLDELIERGYTATTFEGVAARAATSKAVLYRRWPSKSAMVIDAIRAVAEATVAPDTGSLRGDLVGILQLVRGRVRTFPRRTVLGLMADLDAESTRDLNILFLTRTRDIITPAIERARARGELDDSLLSDELVSVPFDLARHDLLLRDELSDERIDMIVDDVALPLWTRAGAASRRRARRSSASG